MTIAAMLLGSSPLALANEDVWPSLQTELFGTRAILENSGVVILDTPKRAEDAALVPITIRVPPSVKGALKGMWLVIDKNPTPVAFSLKFGPAAGDGGGERRVTTRVRIDTFSYVHAVVETADGTLHMAKAFVKAAGGCAAPSPKDAEKASNDLGKMLIKSFNPALPSSALREAQFMIKHPNHNGLQMDYESRAYIPARFIREVTIKRGDDLVFVAETGFALSANPNFRFTMANAEDEDNSLDVVAIDTDETRFVGRSVQKSTIP